MNEKDLFLKKFEEKLRTKLDKDSLQKLSKGFEFDEDEKSVDYEQFRLETLPTGMNKYSTWCNHAEKLLNLKPDKKTAKKFDEQLYKAHLNCTSVGVVSLSILVSIILILFGLTFTLISTTIGIGFVLVGLASYFILQQIPILFVKKLRVKASDEIIIAIFYMVAFMRFNSNLELAVNFAANYLNPPLSLDFKRLLWQIENSEYPNIKQAFDKYLEDWRDENLEFLEAIYLIESSLYESEEFRRISLLDKSLDIILQGNYEKILNFSQELRGKVSTFNMLGVVMPILGLIILPLAASMGDPKGTWEIVFLLYNILFPAIISYYGFMIIFNRPSSINSIKTPKNLKNLVNLQKFKFKISKEKTMYLSPKIPAIAIFLLFFTIGLSPLIIHSLGLTPTLNSAFTNIFGENSLLSNFQEFKKISKTSPSYFLGPYGLIPGLLSLFIPLSFAFGIGYYLRFKYQNLISLRNKTKKLELEFPSATFQLGNRINEGISAELAFGAVAETMKGTEAGVFFSIIDKNIKFNGLSVKKSIFDSKKGAMVNYPSDLIQSSMKILVNAIDKGPEITAKTLVDLSKYLSEIHQSSQRMKDLLSESLGSMKGQANFLSPIISGVVVSIVSLVTLIMGKLSTATTALASQNANVNGATANFLGESIPTYLFQFVVGIYIVMLIAILIYMVSNLENGDDPINTKFQIGDKLIKGLIKYSIVVTIGIVLFSFIGANILKTL